VEHPHSLLILPLAVKLAGGNLKGHPTLALPDKTLLSAKEIFHYYEAQASPEQKLVPADPEGAAAGAAAWPEYSIKLGEAVRNWAYFHFLPTRNAMMPVFMRGIPMLEKPLLFLTYPLVAAVLRSQLGLSQSAADAGLAIVGQMCDALEKTLADGRPYIRGDKFTICDLLFAVNAAPMVLSDEYGGALPAFSATSSEVQRVVTEYRARPAGKYILRMYREERKKTV
jgi:glutathione S-transferase